MDELIKELERLRAHSAQYGYGLVEDREFGSILCRLKAKAEEPLAVLADRKGYWKAGFVSSCDTMAEHYWTCNIQKTSFDIRIDKQRDYDFTGPTYAEAEAKAREYLNKLEDK